MANTTFIHQLPENKQNAILTKVKAHYETELNQVFTDDEKEIVLNSRLCDLEEII